MSEAKIGSRPVLLWVLASDAFGGAEALSRDCIQELSHNFEVILLTQEALVPHFCSLDIRVYTFEHVGLNAPHAYDFRNVWRYARAIAHVARRCKAISIHAVMHNASLFLAAARWLAPLSMRGRRIIGSLHGSLHGFYQSIGRPPSLLERLAVVLTTHTLDGVITPSKGVGHELQSLFGAPHNRLMPIYNGIDLQEIREQSNMFRVEKKDERWIVGCGRLEAQKDFDTLIRAFHVWRLQHERVPTRLVLVGDGSQKEALEALCEELGIQGAVQFTGFQSNPYPWIAAADVLVLPSRYEGFGLVLVEAMALAVPVVASDCPWGPSEIIEHGVSGLLFHVGDIDQLATQLEHVLLDAELANRLSKSGQARAEHFQHSRMTQDYANVLFKD